MPYYIVEVDGPTSVVNRYSFEADSFAAAVLRCQRFAHEHKALVQLFQFVYEFTPKEVD